MHIKSVSPYIYPKQLNFKDRPYTVFKSLYPQNTVSGWYPKFLHALLFRYDLFPSLWQSHKDARIVFVQPVSLYFDANISVLTHEVIPVIWDCWPCYYDKMEKWLKRHRVKTALFTSSQEMDAMQQRCPDIKMIWCPEAIDERLYTEGKQLKDRKIDLLELGRSNKRYFYFNNEGIEDLCSNKVLTKINHVCTKVDDHFIYTDEQLYVAMRDAKITICLPRSITHPDLAQGVETLTQRYWEAMLSRIIILGHAPMELINICGYNPVIEINDEMDYNGQNRSYMQIFNILNHLDDYQSLVDKNRCTALEKGTWNVRLKGVLEDLKNIGYNC